LPSLVIININKLTVNKELLAPIITPWVLGFVLVVVILALSKIFNFSKVNTGAILIVAILGNTSFVGIPMVEHFFGNNFSIYALIYDQLGSFLILATYGAIITSLYSNSTFNLKEVVKNIILFPPFFVLVFSFLLKPYELNFFIKELLNLFSSLLTPIALLSIGLNLNFRIEKEDSKPFFTALFIKLLFSPLLAYLFVNFEFGDSEISRVVVFEAAMGPMVSATIVAINANLNPKLVSSIAGYGIALSFLTLPIIYNLLH